MQMGLQHSVSQLEGPVVATGVRALVTQGVTHSHRNFNHVLHARPTRPGHCNLMHDHGTMNTKHPHVRLLQWTVRDWA